MSDKKKVYVETTVVSDATALPTNNLALHIAIAAFHSVDYLVSWNFKHITNAETIPLVRKICEANGYSCPEICTPQMLQKGELS